MSDYKAFASRERHLLYDWIIPDTPPSVSLFTRPALQLPITSRRQRTRLRGSYAGALGRHKFAEGTA